METSASNLKIAGHLAAVFGGKPEVVRFHDESGKHHVDVLRCPDAPERGVVSFATVGLSDHPREVEGMDKPVCLELTGGCNADKAEAFASILSTAAFCSIKEGWPVYPGAVFGDLVSMYGVSRTMQHVMFTEPFPWDELEPVKLTEKEVLWLMMIPVSESEAVYAEEHGFEALETLFEEKEVDVFDLERTPVV
ncbi:suppressor of fused domain protein [Luteolibacter ambystomatis]|uniref:Suppressor of fused domain protein n=1 Tax=Luteolibacter ambystomatis TaxID=2824561 RepID=A0A975J0J3_9BACT|nr:suppressor of fused domain protein [Luteolibacter ambystomatis]QUE51781.1 suppressor of fused domain protein [Luteolibacter ambystomatis]